MRLSRFAVFLMLGALMTGLCSAAVVVWIAVHQPWIGLTLAPNAQGPGLLAIPIPDGPAAALPEGAILMAISAPGASDEVALSASDILEEPDTLGDAALMRAFFVRQGVLHDILSQKIVQLSVLSPSGAESFAVVPQPMRPIASLPFAFWVQICIGLAGIALAVWVALQRKSDPLARLSFGIASAGLWLTAFGAASYSTRELAFATEMFQAVSFTNFTGGIVGGIGLINLFLIYPIRLVSPKLLWLTPAVQFTLFTIVYLDSPVLDLSRQVAAVVALSALLLALSAQTVLTWRDPVARVILGWFAFSILICSVGFLVAVALPAISGEEQKVAQWSAMGLVLVVYVALAIVVARFRLYDLPDLSFRILFYMGGLVPLLVIDAILIYFLSFEAAPAFGLSLAVVGIFYLPLRDKLALWLGRDKTLAPETVFALVTEVALSTDRRTQIANLNSLFKRLFNPLKIMPAPAAVSVPTLVGNGEAMDLPIPAGLGDLRLSWANGGRGLFSGRNLRYATDVLQTLSDLLERHHAYEIAVSEERSRINRDIHDNVGVLLMGALHSDAVSRKDVLIRQTLKELREIISNQAQEHALLRNLLADLRSEISDHVEATGLALHWTDKEMPDVTLPPRTVHCLNALFRETANNILRHSKASRVDVSVTLKKGLLRIEIADNGIGLSAGQPLGNGIENLQNRLRACGGSFVIASRADGGTSVIATLPLALSENAVTIASPELDQRRTG